MTYRKSYSYTVLRYIHDPLAAEFINVGIVLFAPVSSDGNAELHVRTKKTIGRMRTMFPDLDRSSYIAAMRSVDRAVKKLRNSFRDEGFLPTKRSALSLAYQALPRDDSSLQWSPMGSGLASDLSEVFDKLYHRHVTLYDVKQSHRRSDDEVWRPVRERLAQRKINLELLPKVIEGGDDKIEFQHAWKNGAWHVYEPVSMDLADADGIFRKAHRWLGQLTSVSKETHEAFEPHFIVGAPTNPRLSDAYETAKNILRKAPVPVKIFDEQQIDVLVDQIEDEWRDHVSSTSSRLN
jgi:Protein of unknown function (DUF3037)